MLESLFGSAIKEKVLIYIFCREEWYGREIAGFFKIPLSPVLQHLKKLEAGMFYIPVLKEERRYISSIPASPFSRS